MRAIIAGGSGLLGRALTASLLENGHEVTILSRSPDKVKLPAGAQVAGWDARTPQGWDHLISSADAVINLTGENLGALPWTNERKQRIRASRVDAGMALVEAIARSERRPRVLLQASAVGYYGTSDDERFDERSPFGSDFLSSIAVDWEASTRPVEDLGVRWAAFRSGVVLTPEGGVIPRFLYPFRLYLGGPIGSGKQWISWIHIQDEVNAIRFLLENDTASGTFNLTAPNPVTNAQFGRTLAEVIGKPFWAPIPGFAIKLLYGEMSTVVLEGQYVLPERLLKLGFHFKYKELRPALEDLLSTAEPRKTS